MMGWQDKMKIMKTILYFLILQIIIFSEPTKLDKIIYYRYFPLIEDKLKSGMEIQKIRGYCILVDMKCTTRGVFVAEEMDSWKQGPGESTLKKINIDLSNFKKTFFIGEFRNDYPYFENLRQEILKENKLRKKIEKIKKMLFINDIMLETEMGRSSYSDYYTLGIDYETQTKKSFSDYIIIRTDEISCPFIMDIKNYKPDEEKIELKNLNQIYQYFKNNPYRNLEYTFEKVGEYEKFIEKNININEFENILQREIFELTKELNLE